MRPRKVFLKVAAMVLVLAWPAFAQEQTGAIKGVISDASGALVPGAVVEAASQAGLIMTAVSDTRGVYRFPALPPGVWSVTASLTGFSPAKVENIELSLGKLLSVDLALQPGGHTEELTVTGDSPVIDIEQSASFATIREELVDKVPRGRDFLTLASQAPGANLDPLAGGLSIDGATGGDNRFVIDGIDTTNLQTGTSGKRILTDFVEEVQVKSSGYTAEYGGATGGVVNVITKSGTNSFHGSVGLYFTGDALDARRRPSVRIDPFDDTRAEHVTYDDDSWSNWEPGFSLGGPLVPDRLWFFASYIPSLRTTDRTVTYLTDDSTGTVTRKDSSHFATANISAQLSSKLRARVGMNVAPHTRDGILPSLDGSSNPSTEFGDYDIKRSNFSTSGNIDYVASDRLYFGLRGGYFRYNTVVEGNPAEVRTYFSRTNANVPGVSPDLVRPRGWRNIATNTGTPYDIQSRLSLQLDGTYFATFAGDHTFKAGVQFDRIGNNVFSGYQRPRVYFYWGDVYHTLAGDDVHGTYGYGRAFYYGTYGDIHSDNYGLFFQDMWKVNDRLTLNLGIRTEKENVPSFSEDPAVPDPAIDFGFDKKIAPRLGFAYDVKGDGTWKVYGSWGKFFDTTKLEMPRGSFGGDQWFDHFFTLDTLDWPTIGQNPECPPTCDGMTFIEVIDRRLPSNSVGEHNRIDPNLEPMRSQEFVLGIQHDLGGNMAIGVRYVHKQMDRAIEDQGVVVPGLGEEFFITNPGYGIGRSLIPGLPDQPAAKRDYDAVEIDFRKRMSNNWSLSAKYWWSRLWGNYAGLAGTDEVSNYDNAFDPGSTLAARNSPNVNRIFDGLAMSFDENGNPSYGLLATDRTHQFKMQAVYDLSFGSTLGTSFYLTSGTPISRAGSISPSLPVFFRGRGSDGRTPALFQWDLYVQHEFRLGEQTRLQLSANILNVLDRDTPIRVHPWYAQDDSPLTTEEYLAPGGVDFAQSIADGGVLLDPRFLMSTFFQRPRSVRLSARLTF